MSNNLIRRFHTVKRTTQSRKFIACFLLLLGLVALLSPACKDWTANHQSSNLTDRKLRERDLRNNHEVTVKQKMKLWFPKIFPKEPEDDFHSDQETLFDGKKGACFALRPVGKAGSFVENLPKTLALDSYWNYAWAIDRIEQPDSPLFVPMAWGGYKDIASFQRVVDNSNVHEMIAQNKVKLVMGYNEPDAVEQSNMSVDAAIERWPILESLGVPLVSPSCMRPYDIWMQEFMRKVSEKNLRVDYVGVHWYGEPSFTAFKKNITSYYDMYKLPIIITEFAVADWMATKVSENRYTKDQVLVFMQRALPWLEQTPWIVGYSWFSFQLTWGVGWPSSLFDATGNLNSLGRYYKSVRADNIYGDKSIKPSKWYKSFYRSTNRGNWKN